MKRIFIAINMPEELKQILEDIQKQVSFEQGIAKWVKKDNLHITLAFLGSVDDESLNNISKITRDIAGQYKPFKVRIGDIVYDSNNPRMIWAKIQDNKELREISNRLKQELNIQDKRFSPHITIARIRTWLWKRIEPEERPTIEQSIDYEFTVKSIDIMESVLKRTGPEYTILETINL